VVTWLQEPLPAAHPEQQPEAHGVATHLNESQAQAHRLEPSKDSELKVAVQQAREAGFRAFVVPLRLPATPARGRAFHRQTLQTLESLREAGGADADFVLWRRESPVPAMLSGRVVPWPDIIAGGVG
jgi:hypothetical protein